MYPDRNPPLGSEDLSLSFLGPVISPACTTALTPEFGAKEPTCDPGMQRRFGLDFPAVGDPFPNVSDFMLEQPENEPLTSGHSMDAMDVLDAMDAMDVSQPDVVANSASMYEEWSPLSATPIPVHSGRPSTNHPIDETNNHQFFVEDRHGRMEQSSGGPVTQRKTFADNDQVRAGQDQVRASQEQDRAMVLTFTQVLLHEVDRLHKELALEKERTQHLSEELGRSKDAEKTLRALLTKISHSRPGPAVSPRAVVSPSYGMNGMVVSEFDQKVPVQLSGDQNVLYQGLVNHIAKAIRVSETDSRTDVVNCAKLIENVLPRMPNLSENILPSTATKKAHKCRCASGCDFRCIAAFDDQPSNFKSAEICVTLKPFDGSKTQVRQLFLEGICGLLGVSSRRLKVPPRPQNVEKTGKFSFTVLDELPGAGAGISGDQCSALDAFDRVQRAVVENRTAHSVLRYVEKVQLVDNPVLGTLFYTLHEVFDAEAEKRVKIMVVEYLAVLTEQQRQKIGTRLMEKLKKIGKQAGVDTIVVYSDKDATSWYSSQNFVLRIPSESRKWWAHMGSFSKYTHIDFMTYDM